MAVDRQLAIAVSLIAMVVVFSALYVASAVFAPLALALFVVAIVWPSQSRLQSRLPKPVALAICVLATVIVFLILASLVSWAFGRIGRSLISDAARFQALYDRAATWFESHGLSVTGLWTEHFNAAWLVRTVQQVAARVSTTISFWLLALVYVILGLFEVEEMRRKLHAMSNREAARMLIEASTATASKFRTYMLVRTQMSVLTGVLVWFITSIAGLQFAPEWGVLAFVLNYVPFIGPFVATVCPTLFAVTQFESWQIALVILISLGMVQFMVGSYIEPRVAGSALSMSPFVVLFAVFFWTFLWGPFGAFIGVPITIAIVTFCARHPSCRWVAELLGEAAAGKEGA